MALPMSDGQLCLLCKANNIRSFLHSYQINLAEAIVLCENSQCSYPVGSTNSCVTYSRSFKQIESARLNDDSSKASEAQVALQARMAGDPRTKSKLFRTVIGTQTEKRTTYKLDRKLTNSIKQKSNGLVLNGDASTHTPGLSALNRRGAFASGQETHSINNKTSHPPLENGVSGVSQKPHDRNSPSCMSIDGEKLFKGYQFTSINKPQKLVSKSEPQLDKIQSENTKSNTACQVFQETCQQKASLQTIHKTDFRSSELVDSTSDKSLKYETCSSHSGGSSKLQKLTAKRKQFILQQAKSFFSYSDTFVQWRNRDALCWLDTVQCLLVHNRHVRKTVFERGFDHSSVLFKLLFAHKQAQELLENIKSNQYVKLFQTNGDGLEILSKISSHGKLSDEAAKSSPRKTVEMKLVDMQGSIDVKTGAGNVDCTRSLAEEMSKNESEHNNTLKVSQIDSLLNNVRENIWQKLQPRLKFERGRNDSPVFTMSSLLRENPDIENLFKMSYSFRCKCHRCGLTEEDDYEKVLPTLPGVLKSFSISQPTHTKVCSQCGCKDARRTMKYKRLSECMLVHFTEGLPHTNWKKLEFGHDGNVYTVTAVVQYTSNPDHFIAWLRNPTDGLWMRCDDLQSPLCAFQSNISLPPNEIHMVMWEKIPLLASDTSIDQNSAFKGTQDTDVNFHHQDHDQNKPIPLVSEMNIPSNVSSYGSEIPSGRFRVPKERRSPSTSSELSDDLPEFASVPPSLTMLKPVPCHKVNASNIEPDSLGVPSENGQETETVTHNTGSDINAGMESEYDASGKILKENLSSGQALSGAILSGLKSEIKPSTVFCVPNKSSSESIQRQPICPPYTHPSHADAETDEKISIPKSNLNSSKTVQLHSTNKFSVETQENVPKKETNNDTQVNKLDISEIKPGARVSGKSDKFRFTKKPKLNNPVITYLKKRDFIAPTVSRDKFMTLNINEEKSKNLLNMNSNQTPLPSPLQQQNSSISYLGKVQQYLLNKVNLSDSKFDGLMLKSLGSNELNEVELPSAKFSETSLDNSCGRVISPISECFGRRSPTKSIHSFSVGTRKRKSPRDFEGLVKRTCSENVLPLNASYRLSSNGTSDRAENGLDRCRGLSENSQQKSFDAKSAQLLKRVTNGEHSNISDSVKSRLSPATPDCVLQDLYEALNIPNEDIGNTMATIMSDVDDLIGLVKLSETANPNPRTPGIEMVNGHSGKFHISSGHG